MMSIIIKLTDTIEKNQLVSCPKIQDVQSRSIVCKRQKLKSIMCNFALKNVSSERASNKTTRQVTKLQVGRQAGRIYAVKPQ